MRLKSKIKAGLADVGRNNYSRIQESGVISARGERVLMTSFVAHKLAICYNQLQNIKYQHQPSSVLPPYHSCLLPLGVDPGNAPALTILELTLTFSQICAFNSDRPQINPEVFNLAVLIVPSLGGLTRPHPATHYMLISQSSAWDRAKRKFALDLRTKAQQGHSACRQIPEVEQGEKISFWAAKFGYIFRSFLWQTIFRDVRDK